MVDCNYLDKDPRKKEEEEYIALLFERQLARAKSGSSNLDRALIDNKPPEEDRTSFKVKRDLPEIRQITLPKESDNFRQEHQVEWWKVVADELATALKTILEKRGEDLSMFSRQKNCQRSTLLDCELSSSKLRDVEFLGESTRGRTSYMLSAMEKLLGDMQRISTECSSRANGVNINSSTTWIPSTISKESATATNITPQQIDIQDSAHYSGKSKNTIASGFKLEVIGKVESTAFIALAWIEDAIKTISPLVQNLSVSGSTEAFSHEAKLRKILQQLESMQHKINNSILDSSNTRVQN